ncbi:MAG: outer membrane beta-barrel protein [Candidatus Kapaibacteriota bacterium]
MKILLATAFCVLMMVSSTALFAQTDTTEASSEAPHVGLGISLLPYTFPNNDTYLVQPAGTLSWYAPVQFGKHFRCEVEFSYMQSHDSLRLQLSSTVGTNNYRISTFGRVGLGVYYTHPFDLQTRLYAGLRSGLVTSSVQWKSFIVGSTMTSPFVYDEGIGSFWIGGVLGFEYLLTKHIAIGAEAHLTSYATGATNSYISTLPSNYPARFPVGRTSDAALTSANVAIRFFF